MNALEHALTWVRGELLEHTAVGIYGFGVVALGALFWRFGSSPAARGLVAPLIVAGSIFVAIGAGGGYLNTRRLSEYRQRHHEDAGAFVAAEKARTEAFLTWYPYTLGFASVLVAAGLLLFSLRGAPAVRGLSLGLMLFGFGGLLIDNLSEANAKAYAAALAALSAGR